MKSTVPNNQVSLKSPREIELMRAAGGLVYGILEEIQERIAPGVTTNDLDRIAATRIREAGAVALFLGVEHQDARFPFPASICASVNEEVVHGIPNDRPLKEGDIVSVDCGVRLSGYCGDSARTFAVGKIDRRAQQLLDVTRGALDLAIEEARPFRRWSEIARKMQKYVESRGFGVVREFVGHGLGREMWEEPKVPNYYDRRTADFDLVPGLVLAVEPMVTAGRPGVDYKDRDRWAVVTKDRSLAAHFEHDLAITDSGVDVLSGGGNGNGVKP